MKEEFMELLDLDSVAALGMELADFKFSQVGE